MSRKKTSPDSVNPLHRMFGTYLRVTRRQLGKSTEDASNELGLTESYYRLIEAGAIPIAPGLAFGIIRLLSGQGVGQAGQPRTIHFHRLAVFLTAAQWVSGEMVRLSELADLVLDPALKAIESLAEIDADFDLFHSRTRKFFDYGKDDPTLRNFLEGVGVTHVADFLANSDYAKQHKGDPTEEIWPKANLLGMSSLNAELVMRTANELAGRLISHTPPLASAWEDRSSSSILDAHGIFGSAVPILSEENFKYFHYHYLRQPAFRTLRFIFLDGQGNNSLREEFIERLNRARLAAGHDAIEERYTIKIEIIRPNGPLTKKLKDHVSEIFTDLQGSFGEPVRYDSYWAFNLSLGSNRSTPVAFLGKNDHYGSRIDNLTLGRSIEKRQLFEKVWNELNKAAL